MKKIIAYILAPMLFIASSCDDFGDINVNPNASEVPLTSALLTNALTAMGGSTTGGANLVAGFYAQYFTEALYTDNCLYGVQDVDWAGEMAGSMFDLKNIININSDPATAGYAALNGSNNNQIAIARILLAYRFSVLSDRYGDIPYFEALQLNTQPTIDDQEAIYNDLFNELDEAVAQFDNNGNVKGDILYGGNNENWKKFANTLRMILALRVSVADPTLGQTQFAAALAADGGVFESNDDNAVLDYPGGGFRNPWYGIGADQGVTDVIADFLNANNDLRENAFGKPASGTLIGVPYGLVREDAISWTAANPGWSLILNDGFRAEGSELFVLTYADALLARSQGADYGWSTEDEEALYYDAIKASWEQWGVYIDGNYLTYIADPDIDLNTGTGMMGATTKTQKIALQRWLTFYPNGPQGWSEWRRTGIPALVPTINAINTSKQIPRRFPFPSVEYSYNPANIDAAVARMGGDNDAIKVWWDAN